MNTEIASEQLSFWTLLQKHKIKIPIIQRDYAQGRADKIKIRGLFLDSLFDSLTTEKRLVLDFVYGSVKNDALQPLDGQQRLTTLFLLHWYIAVKEDKLDDNTKALLQKFTYETRTSSRDFCLKLVNKGIDFSKIKDNSISKTLIDASWFFLAWKKDPTISAMLIMLDAIHEKFGKEDNLWNDITTNTKITFYYIPLENFGFSDDLYIKMNARGEPLTNFEHFKARFEQYIKQEDEKQGKENWEKEITKPTDKFAHKMDTTWTDLFWDNRDSDNKIDDAMLKFIAGIAVINYAQNQEIWKNSTLDEIEKEATKKAETARIEKRISDLSNSPKDIKPDDFPSQKAFGYLKKCLDKYAENDFFAAKLQPENLPLWSSIKTVKDTETTTFTEFIKKENTTYKQRVLFYAQTQYLLKAESFDTQKFAEWMRVVRNIVENTTIDSATTLIGAIGLIQEMSKGSADIYIYLSKNAIKSGFASGQVREEVLKAGLIVGNQACKTAIHQAEDTNFCKGKIEFALYCIDFEKLEDAFDADKLNKIKAAFEEYLNDGTLVSNDFRRALLTIGDNKFYDYWAGSWITRTDIHKRCLIEDMQELKHHRIRPYLKKLVNQLTKTKLLDIIREYKCPNEMPNWKKRLIKQEDLLNDHCNSKYFGIPSNNDACYLFGSYKRPKVEQCYKVE